MSIKAKVAQVLLSRSWDKSVNDTNVPITSPWPWADFYPSAKLNFIRFGSSFIVLNNDSGQALAFGPALTGSRTVDLSSTNIISGHNDSHFSILEKLVIGDKVMLTVRNGKQKRYQLLSTQVLDIRQVQLTVDKQNQELLMVTCYPFGSLSSSTPLRFVARFIPMSKDS